MTDYDRGAFVDKHDITIKPCANGTFVLLRGDDYSSGDMPFKPMIREVVAFSSASDMLRFLQSEYGHDADFDEVKSDEPSPQPTDYVVGKSTNPNKIAHSEAVMMRKLMKHRQATASDLMVITGHSVEEILTAIGSIS